MNQTELDYMNAQMRIAEFHREAEREQLLRLARRESPKPPSAWRIALERTESAAAHLAGHVLESTGRHLLQAGERLHGQIHAHEPQPCAGEAG